MTEKKKSDFTDAAGNNKVQTISGLLVQLDNPEEQALLEECRLKHEAKFGPTDLTKRYATCWPVEQQHWLLEHDPQRYFDALPAFVGDYLKIKAKIAISTGKLDDFPDGFVRLFCAHNKKPGQDDRNQGPTL